MAPTPRPLSLMGKTLLRLPDDPKNLDKGTLYELHRRGYIRAIFPRVVGKVNAWVDVTKEGGRIRAFILRGIANGTIIPPDEGLFGLGAVGDDDDQPDENGLYESWMGEGYRCASCGHVFKENEPGWSRPWGVASWRHFCSKSCAADNFRSEGEQFADRVLDRMKKKGDLKGLGMTTRRRSRSRSRKRSRSSELVLYCMNPRGCGRTITIARPGSTRGVTYTEAKARGWRRTSNGDWFCPYH